MGVFSFSAVESAPHPLTWIVTAIRPRAALTQLDNVVHISGERAASAVALLDGRLVDERVDLRERVLGLSHAGGCEGWSAAACRARGAVKLVEAVVKRRVGCGRRAVALMKVRYRSEWEERARKGRSRRGVYGRRKGRSMSLDQPHHHQ